MRVLFLSNFYPPLELGGWEQLTGDLRDGLQDRGHDTVVLTSRHRASEAPLGETGVHRLLELESSDFERYHPAELLRKPQIDRHNRNALRTLAAKFKPEVIFIHSMWNLAHCLAWEAEQVLPGRVLYYMASDWPYQPQISEAYWQAGVRRAKLLPFKRLVAALPMAYLAKERSRKTPALRHILCVSQAVKETLASRAGIPCERMQVIYNGVDVDRFSPMARIARPDGRLSLLYAGSLLPHKGVHTAIEAMHTLAAYPDLREARLTIVGSGRPDYEALLRQMVQEMDLGQKVFFEGRRTRQEIPALLQQHDILIFPSIWEEPLARMMQEAMACGLVVIGTPTGGTPELLQDGETGLTFPAENAQQLAEKILGLAREPALYQRLAENGRKAVVERFNMRRMIQETEASLAHLTQ